MDNVESIRLLLADPRNAALKARWNEFSKAALARAEDKGVELTAEDLLSLSSVQVYVISGQHIDAPDEWESEAKLKLASFKRAAEAERLRAALENETDADHKQAVDQWAEYSPQERMRRAREAGLKLEGPLKAEAASDLPTEDKAALIQKLNAMPRGMRIAKAREWGLA